MKLQIKTLSPIHIGNGEKYNGLSYVEDIFSTPKTVFILDFDRVVKVLNPNDLKSFTDWVVSEDHASWFKFCKFGINKPQVQNELKKVATYKLDNYSSEINLRDIDCFIKENNKPYIPGTEIKGAMRTAVGYHLLSIDKNYNWLKDMIIMLQNKFRNSFLLLSKSGKKGRDSLKLTDLRQIPKEELRRLFGEKIGDEIFLKIQKGIDPRITVNRIKGAIVKETSRTEDDFQKSIFRCEKNNDAKYDLLKLLYISDTEPKETNCLFVSNIKVEGINRQFPLFQEFCKKDQVFTCQGFKLDNNELILNKLGFSQEQKWIVSEIKNLFQCCHEFTARLLLEEMNYFNKCNNQRIITKLKVIQQHNTPDTPVLRIGKNEGYLSLTVGLFVKDRDKDLYDDVLCHATKNTSYTGLFPKTRRIVNLENGDVDTCGWIKLSIV